MFAFMTKFKTQMSYTLLIGVKHEINTFHISTTNTGKCVYINDVMLLLVLSILLYL